MHAGCSSVTKTVDNVLRLATAQAVSEGRAQGSVRLQPHTLHHRTAVSRKETGREVYHGCIGKVYRLV